MREHLGFFLIAFSAVFFVVDPLALIPMFLAMTEHESGPERARTVLRASLTSGLTLIVFAVAGGLIFRVFGISLAAFRIAGGILLFLVALEMMNAQRERSRPEEDREGILKRDVAIIPLAIPLLSGPGAIATVMVLMTRHTDWHYGLSVIAAIVLTSVLTYVLLRGASYLQRHLSRTFLNVVSRLMGLILAAIAVEFVLGGLREALPLLTRP